MDKITITDLNLHYGSFQALKHIDLGLREHRLTPS
jgi:ABC-type phosphate transport system ATPase subunit